MSRRSSWLAIAIAALALLSCTAPSPEATPYLTPTPLLTATPAPATQIAGRADPVSGSALRTKATVNRVIDGDTIEAIVAGATYKVRYIGVDTPELPGSNTGSSRLAMEAYVKNRELVEGKLVDLEKDVSETDRYGRLLRYVYIGDLFVNAELVRLGYAQAVSYPPDTRYDLLLQETQKQAKDLHRGVWAAEAAEATRAVSSPAPTKQPTAPTASQADTTPAPPESTAVSPTLTPTGNPSPNLTLQISVTSPVRRGGRATLQAKTAPQAQCSISVVYKSGPSKAQGLQDEQADGDGNVLWTWTIGTTTAPGSWPITVTATLADKTVSQTVYFTVQ